MTQQHTPTPWTYQPLQPFMKGCPIGTGDLAIPTASTLIATAWNTTRGLSGPQGAETEANARFIVQACNAHEELLAALEDLLVFFKSGNDVPVERAIIHADSVWVAKARAAIAKATSPQAQ